MATHCINTCTWALLCTGHIRYNACIYWLCSSLKYSWLWSYILFIPTRWPRRRRLACCPWAQDPVFYRSLYLWVLCLCLCLFGFVCVCVWCMMMCDVWWCVMYDDVWCVDGGFYYLWVLLIFSRLVELLIRLPVLFLFRGFRLVPLCLGQLL